MDGEAVLLLLLPCIFVMKLRKYLAVFEVSDWSAVEADSVLFFVAVASGAFLKNCLLLACEAESAYLEACDGRAFRFEWLAAVVESVVVVLDFCVSASAELDSTTPTGSATELDERVLRVWFCSLAAFLESVVLVDEAAASSSGKTTLVRVVAAARLIALASMSLSI